MKNAKSRQDVHKCYFENWNWDTIAVLTISWLQMDIVISFIKPGLRDYQWQQWKLNKQMNTV